MIRDHKIQNHSWSHPNLATAKLEKVQSELADTQKIIKQVTGISPDKIRPPYGAGGWTGKIDPEISKVAKNLSLTIQNWDIDTEDWQQPSGIGTDKLTMIKKQFDRSAGARRFNVLMHVQNETARDLPNFISELKTWGFTFQKP